MDKKNFHGRYCVIKRICIIAAFVCISGFVFAQTLPKAVLSEVDVDSFIENFDDILNALNECADESFSFMQEIFLQIIQGKDTAAEIAKLRNLPASAELRKELACFGLEDNAFEKCVVFLYGIHAVYLEQQLASVGTEERNSERVAQGGDILKILKAAFHSDDLALISLRKDEILAIIIP